jgi:hypothetical protein
MFGHHEASDQETRNAKEDVNADPTAIDDATMKRDNDKDR